LPPLFDRLEHWYRSAISRPTEVVARWETLSTYARGCRVYVESADEAIEGVTQGLAASGALKVRLQNGEVREVVSGEVRLRTVNRE
jgi:biotin-(acetyl-CoA carboxylase) ligase